MRGNKQPHSQNLRLAFLFFFVIFSIVVLSLLLKLFFLAKDSHFDNQHRFTMEIVQQNPEVLSFSPQTSSISIIRVNGEVNNQSLAQYLGIPIDVVMVTNEVDTTKPVTVQLKSLFFHHSRHGEELTLIDVVRLLLFTQGVSPNAYNSVQLTNNEDTKTVDGALSTYFNDDTIVSEKKNIEIINASGVSGLGNRLARVITNMGGQVVLVKTADQLTDASSVSAGSSSYTLSKLQNILHIGEVAKGQGSIADIVVTVGKDVGSNPAF